MDRQEKIKAIVERAKILQKSDIEIDSAYLSMLTICGYIDKICSAGLMVENPYKVTESGKDVIAICEEFDWQPSNEEINMFVIAMVPKPEQIPIAWMLTEYRDKREEFIEFSKKSKNNFGNN